MEQKWCRVRYVEMNALPQNGDFKNMPGSDYITEM
jgi:hypothetical protein